MSIADLLLHPKLPKSKEHKIASAEENAILKVLPIVPGTQKILMPPMNSSSLNHDEKSLVIPPEKDPVIIFSKSTCKEQI